MDHRSSSGQRQDGAGSAGSGLRVPPHGRGMRIGLFGGTFDPPHGAHRAACLIAMKRLALRGTPAFTVVEAPDLPAAYDMLAGGKAAAFASDDILHEARRLSQKEGRPVFLFSHEGNMEPGRC